MKLHHTITLDRVCALAERTMFDADQIGICNGCGEEQMGVEPDARRYHCEVCGEPAVYGVEELLLEIQP